MAFLMALFRSAKMTDALSQFSDAIRAAGLQPPDVIEADGKLRRFASNGKRGDNAGWYVMFDGAIPAGGFGDWRTGIRQTWRADIGRKLTKGETTAHRAIAADIRKQRAKEERDGNDAAAAQAATIWQAAIPAPDSHPYPVRKGIKAHGVKVIQSGKCQGWLAVPLRDTSGKLWNIERIAPEKPADGSTDKKGLFRGRRTGCHYVIGEVAGAAALCIAEGFATGASIHEATGYPVTVAFNAGNLLAVAKAMREKFPDLPLILCADDDWKTDGNPGLTKATEAARAVGGLLAIPAFGANRPDGAADFNDLAQTDLAQTHGAEAVAQAIANALASGDAMPTPEQTNAIAGDLAIPDNADTQSEESDLGLIISEVSAVSGVQASNDGLSADTPAETPGVSEVSDGVERKIPDLAARPCYSVFDDWIEESGEKFRPGVWYFGFKENKESVTPVQSWICSPLHVEAVTFDGQGNNFGRMLRFKTTTGKWRAWAMPMELLRGAGDELRGELLAMGVEIDPTHGRTSLGRYLQAKPPKRRIRCALQVGWCGDSFVLPDTVIGAAASGVMFQSGERGHDEYTQAGTLAGWQAEIAARAIGNPVLVMALAASFAGALLAKCNAESGGIHFVGDSATGKSSAVEAACATWGGSSFKRSWNTTANGLEGAAAMFNDSLLVLDEISECNPQDVGKIVYALGNGVGKQRAGRTGSARAVTRWKCFVLSSGERTVSTTMQEAGHRAKAGQLVRLLDVPAARQHGAWDDLHGLQDGTAFSDAIKLAAKTHYGHAGRAFLEKLTRDKRNFSEYLEQFKRQAELSDDAGEGQAKRAAGRFAMLALAGELATEYGITGWPEGEALKAGGVGFKAWQSLRGKGNDERRQILERVSGFIERHGDSRFSDAGYTGETQTRDRAGWWRDTDGERIYLFNAEGMREALKGFDFGRALDTLQAAGALPAPGADGKRARFNRIGGLKVKLYPVQADKLWGDHGA
ncbi:MAG: DUF927 domain-containing protein [Rhodocyclaceae bacterium]|nr:DUF927 domain-containing protein [Rhodocyclaceae bacterium]